MLKSAVRPLLSGKVEDWHSETHLSLHHDGRTPERAISDVG
jgi:hypothetical protein